MREVATDILIFHNIFTKEFCTELLNRIDKWEITKEYNPKFWTYDAHLKRESNPYLFAEIEKGFRQASSFYLCSLVKVHTAFVNKFTPDTIKGIGIHQDHNSYLTGMVKLNNSYEGGELFFPRQTFTTAEAGVGDLIVWPGNVTHPHGGQDVIEGIKHNLVIWTERNTEEWENV